MGQVKSQRSEPMKLFTVMKNCRAKGAMIALMIAANGAGCTFAQSSTNATSTSKQASDETRFYCNIKALSLAERAHQKQLTDKLIASRTQIVETPKGYEFQFDPATVSLGEVVEWVVTEEKCCPFYYFHIDLEREGNLVCLGLTGQEGIKQFIRAEFQVPPK
jgi:hypothetical protein